jgi:hypothetical protein
VAGAADEHVTGIGLIGDVQKVFDIAVDKPRHTDMADTRPATEVRSQPVDFGEVEKALD